jgi:hypothetical protein
VIRLIALLAAAQLAMAQGGPGIAGNWLGTLEPGPVKLRLALKVAKGADGRSRPSWTASIRERTICRSRRSR